MHDSVALFSNYIIAFEWETVEWLLSAIMGTSRLPPSAQPACGQDEIPLSASGAEGRLIAHFHKRHQAWFKTRALEPKASTATSHLACPAYDASADVTAVTWSDRIRSD